MDRNRGIGYAPIPLRPSPNIGRAGEYETAEKLLETRHFDLAILDIMGVSGYELLEICVKKHIVAVRWGYLADKINNYSHLLAGLAHKMLKRFNVENRLIPINFLGLINAYA